jgi:hydroxyacylglutathione hydrolase
MAGTKFSVTPIQALSDNFMYLVHEAPDSTSKQRIGVVVDAVDAKACVEAAMEAGVQIVAALTTHHHFDHAGGNEDLAKLVPDVDIIGGEPVQAMTRKVVDAEELHFGSLCVRCVHTPAHTNGHMSYLVSAPGSDGPAALFSGDALFVGGCGRFFEGGPEQMLEGTTKLAGLPATTKLYCGHVRMPA